MRNTVYSASGRVVVFEGTNQECKAYILQFGYHMKNGSIIYRTWTDENGDTYWDMGSQVFICNNLK